MLFSKSKCNLSKLVQTSKKSLTLSLSIWQKGQLSLWTRVFFVLHVTRQFKSICNLVNICWISGLCICVIYGLNSTPSFNDNNTRKRDNIFMDPRRFWRYWSSSRWINILWKFVCHNSEDWAKYRENRFYIYCTLCVQLWLALFALKNASLRMAFFVPFSKRRQYLIAKPHACAYGDHMWLKYQMHM